MRRYLGFNRFEEDLIFVGKCAILVGYLPELNGSIIHYREEEGQNVRAWRLDDAFSLDVTAWECARHYGAMWMTVYIDEDETFYYAPRHVVDRSPRETLHEFDGEQIRVPWGAMAVRRGFAPTLPYIRDPDCIILNDWAPSNLVAAR
jgi:hypothetical protein